MRGRRIRVAAPLLLAVPGLLWLPVGFSMVSVSGYLLVFGFQDFLVFHHLLATVIGVALAVGFGCALWTCFRSQRLGVCWVMSGAVFLFSASSLPLARWLTGVEQRQRYRESAADGGGSEGLLSLAMVHRCGGSTE